MPTRRHLLALIGTSGIAVTFGCSSPESQAAQHYEFPLTDAEWRKRLSPAQYRVLRQAGTERAFTSPLDREKRDGIFACAGCGLPLYSSRTKYDSRTGWPSFTAPLRDAIRTRTDFAIGVPRTEVICRRCGSHLGHVFNDGPPPGGKRYCMNGLAMAFRPS
ncbi:peptide-methionine (R)-S-oxide reductase MsrB [Sphingomonas sp.]|uniref:peptide-methionine (R)-S-oxide reductase MsrB n=1 Tax=Sphingomonas sp. TaxID=28214 RepID=UPI002ED9A73A